MAYNKIIFGNETLIDLTLDDVTASDVASGKKFHDRTGEEVTGTNTYDADTRDADAIAGDILATRTAYVNGSKVTGTMTNNGAVNGYVEDVNTPYTIPAGYHDGTGTVDVNATDKAKIIPSNIKDGVEILGVTGTYSGGGATAQAKSATPYTDKSQVILPDEGYDYLSQVTVAQISKTETPNSAGGTTVTIGDVSPS